MTKPEHDDVPKEQIGREVVQDLLKRSSERYLELFNRVFAREHDLLVAEVTRRFRRSDSESGVASVPTQSVWIEIESLSRLRGIVGGRFQNLRDRWVGAGFPLREHRGDKDGEFTVNETGWIELSNWVLKQGFESRLTPEKPGCLFELRALRSDT